jgi:hypothetical protein
VLTGPRAGRSRVERLIPVLAALAGAAAGYILAARGALTLDLNVGRRIRPLGPIALTIGAPPDTVFDVIAGPYLGRTPRATHDKLRVLERGSDMVLAALPATRGGPYRSGSSLQPRTSSRSLVITCSWRFA